MKTPLRFSASIVSGSGRGKNLGTPTLNLDMNAIPHDLKEGIYVCKIENKTLKMNNDGVLHYGPRPVFNDTPSCEVHLLHASIDEKPDSITVRIVKRLRDIKNFDSVQALQTQIEKDIARADVILKRTKHA